LALRIDLVGLRLSIAWGAAASLDDAPRDARIVVHTTARPGDAAPRSPRPPPASRPAPAPRRGPPPPLSEPAPHDRGADSTVSIAGPAPPSLPLPFASGAEKTLARPPEASPPSAAAAAAPPPRLAPSPPAADERRSIGQILAARGEPSPAPAAIPASAPAA